jgi:Uma2 family endonuclease
MKFHTIIEEVKNSLNMPQIIQELENLQAKETNKRKEFYALVHENIKAEFINGEIVFQSPVKRGHWKISARLSSRMSLFVEKEKIGEIGIEKAMIHCTRNDYEPDICFFGNQKAQTFTDQMLLFPPPDLAVEIVSKSTEKIDCTIKFIDYAEHGVTEYWIIDVEKQTFEQYILETGQNFYTLRSKITQQGIIHSMVMQGFVINIEDLFRA